MVVQWGQKRKEEQRKGEWAMKEELAKDLMKYSRSLITLSLMYAEHFEKFGFDITKKWETTEEQKVALQEVYNKGYEDGFYERSRRVVIREGRE